MTRIARILCVALAWLITAPAMADEILPQGRVTNNGDIFVGRYKIGKSRPGKATPDISDQLVTPPQSVATSLAEAVAGRGAYAGWRVQPDKTIQGPDGSRFVARGVTFLDGLFVSYETRSDYRYRTVPGQSTTAGGSTPTGYEASVWGSAARGDLSLGGQPDPDRCRACDLLYGGSQRLPLASGDARLRGQNGGPVRARRADPKR